MSPEQARGKPVDKRADTWVFGCVLYEMLTGMQAFRGATVSETLADVLKSEPPWTALSPETRTKLRARPKSKASEGAQCGRPFGRSTA